MTAEIHILHLEDSDADAELVAASLRKHGLACEIERVQTRSDFIEALKSARSELILSDFSLPSFDGLSALELARQLQPEIPFIFVTGTLGEEVAITALKAGASDYVFKHRLLRVGPAVERALADAAKRQELQRAETAMIQSEHKYRQLFESLSEAALLADVASGRVLDSNRQAESLLGCERAKILGARIEQLLSTETLLEYRRRLIETPGAAPQGRAVFDGEILAHDGHSIPVTISAAPLVLHERRLVLGLYRDISAQKKTASELEEVKRRLAECLQRGPGLSSAANGT